MRITIDLPGSLVRELKTRAAQDVQSLESLLNELIQRAMRMPASPDLAQQAFSDLPVLQRLHVLHDKTAKPSPAQSNEALEDQALQEDLEKLRRIRFIR